MAFNNSMLPYNFGRRGSRGTMAQPWPFGPSFGWEDPWANMEAPSKLFDQFFGRSLVDDDLLKDMKGMYIRKPSMPTLTGLSEVCINQSL